MYSFLLERWKEEEEEGGDEVSSLLFELWCVYG